MRRELHFGGGRGGEEERIKVVRILFFFWLFCFVFCKLKLFVTLAREKESARRFGPWSLKEEGVVEVQGRGSTTRKNSLTFSILPREREEEDGSPSSLSLSLSLLLSLSHTSASSSPLSPRRWDARNKRKRDQRENEEAPMATLPPSTAPLPATTTGNAAATKTNTASLLMEDDAFDLDDAALAAAVDSIIENHNKESEKV